MKFNDEMQVPYVSKELCEYLRKTYSLQMMLQNTAKMQDGHAEFAMGSLYGVNEVIERLEAIQVQQEEDNGICR